jgi:hypothetical protein
METDKKRIRLDEVTLMRTILALLIVFMHAFTCYDGCWRQPAGYVDIPLYKWLARFSFAYTLEAFVFISGYLFAFQRLTLNRIENMGRLIVNKLKRLMLPSIIFSVLYFILFYEYNSASNMVYSVINGCGHMWYLPMLFWCFVGGWLLEQVKIKDSWKLAFLVVLNLCSYLRLPLRLSNAFSFLIYFYGGFLCYKHSNKIKSLIAARNLVIFWVVFVVLFVVFRPLRDVLTAEDTFSRLQKLLFVIGNHACQLLYASAGLIAFYTTVVYYTQKHQLSKATITIAACCFGIYLFQQFVLQLLYYKTEFPLLVGPYWLPLCGFIIAAVVSYVLSDLLLKSNIGRFLIG